MAEAGDRLGMWTLKLECEEKQRWEMWTLKLKCGDGVEVSNVDTESYSEKKMEAGDVDRSLFFSP